MACQDKYSILHAKSNIGKLIGKSLLARRWESALLVNFDNNTLARLMKNEEAMNELMSIEGSRSLNQDIETIINKSEAVQKIKKEANGRELAKKEKETLSEEEKEYKSKRKQIQEKLIKFCYPNSGFHVPYRFS